MADDGSAQSATIWPLPDFVFAVEFGNLGTVQFQGVSGLDVQTQVIEYRHSNSPLFSPIKMPGLQRGGNVTLKKGWFSGSGALWNWVAGIELNSIEPQMVTVSLLDESGTAMMVWTLTNAWPAKLTAADPKSDGDQVAIESIEIVYETLTIANRGGE